MAAIGSVYGFWAWLRNRCSPPPAPSQEPELRVHKRKQNSRQAGVLYHSNTHTHTLSKTEDTWHTV